MTIRVIAGIAKGKRLKLVPGDSTRPIMDRVKESLFNIIGQDILDCRFLDLFAGTGSVGIEALSRGAAFALLLDIDTKAVRTIQDNLRLTRLEDRAAVRKQDAFALLKSHPEEGTFDIIYVAPPQYKAHWRLALEMLDANLDWLSEDGMVIVQIDPTEKEQVATIRLEAFDERRYGNTLLWFFRRKSLTSESDAGLLSSDYLKRLEATVDELMSLYAITAPPIPIERMLQAPRPQMWEEIDVTQISTGFLKITTPYSLRMSLARFLARVVSASLWGQAHGLRPFDDHSLTFQRFARMILMPASMIAELGEEARTPALMSVHFEVPEEDARSRIDDLSSYI